MRERVAMISEVHHARSMSRCSAAISGSNHSSEHRPNSCASDCNLCRNGCIREDIRARERTSKRMTWENPMKPATVNDSAIHATRVRRMFLCALGVTALSLGAVTVEAANPPQVEVSLAGLNLATQQDAKTAYSRLRNAAKTVCRPLESTDPRGRMRHKQCYQDALANAVADVNSASVTALLNSDRSVRLAQRDGMRNSGS
jgi:UrcA family protein